MSGGLWTAWKPKTPESNMSVTRNGTSAAITLLLQNKVSKTSIARIVEASPMTLDHFIRTRKLQPSQRQPG